jgi:phosphatidylglycerophosphate synthase
MEEELLQQSGKKIPDCYENPIDILLLKINNYFNPWYRSLKFSPNTLTTLSLVITLIGLIGYRYNYVVTGAILYFVGYYFDCADGNYARKYGLVTKFGDYYDHFSDVFKYLVFIWVLVSSPIQSSNKLRVIIILILFLVGMLVHLGCQELIYYRDGESGTLSCFKSLCRNKDWINITRYFGCGTFQLIITIVLLLVPYLK